jgi:hypothetical protein
VVVLGNVQDEVPIELAGGCVHDPDVQVVHQQDDGGSGVDASDSNVVESAIDSQGDTPGLIDAISAYPVVGLVTADSDGRLRTGGVGDGRGARLRQ